MFTWPSGTRQVSEAVVNVLLRSEEQHYNCGWNYYLVILSGVKSSHDLNCWPDEFQNRLVLMVNSCPLVPSQLVRRVNWLTFPLLAQMSDIVNLRKDRFIVACNFSPSFAWFQDRNITAKWNGGTKPLTPESPGIRARERNHPPKMHPQRPKSSSCAPAQWAHSAHSVSGLPDW